MAETKIAWTSPPLPDGTINQGYTFNPWMGCAKVHTGCTHCYAENQMDTRYGKVQWGDAGTRVLTTPNYWAKPMLWNTQAGRMGVKKLVFCASLADVFEDWGDKPMYDSKGDVAMSTLNHQGVRRPLTMSDVRLILFTLIDVTPNLTWLLLTKRPENIRRMWEGNKRRDNVWLGTSISDKKTAMEFAPRLQECRGLSPVLFLSYEPMIGPIKIEDELRRFDWLIAGGESGANARVCDMEWIRSVVDDCRYWSVPCFVKQMGANVIDSKIGPGRVRFDEVKGDDPHEWPQELRVREFPKALNL